MAQDLVDDDLEEQGRHEREDLDEERGPQHVGQRFPVTPEGGQEPAKPEGLRVEAGTGDLAPDEQQFGLHLGQEVVGRESLVDAGDGVDEAQAPVREPAAEHHEAALAPFGDGGRRGGGELLFRRADRAASLQADDPAGPHQIVGRGVPADDRQFTLQVGGIGGDPEVGCNSAQGPQAGVFSGRCHHQGSFGFGHAGHLELPTQRSVDSTTAIKLASKGLSSVNQCTRNRPARPRTAAMSASPRQTR